jgi:hypothetical protein
MDKWRLVQSRFLNGGEEVGDVADAEAEDAGMKRRIR